MDITTLLTLNLFDFPSLYMFQCCLLDNSFLFVFPPTVFPITYPIKFKFSIIFFLYRSSVLHLKHFALKKIFFWPHHQHMESLFPDQGWNMCPLHWKCRVLNTGLSGEFLKHFAFMFLWASQASQQ